MAISNQKQRKVSFSIQSDKLSASFKQSQKSQKIDFKNVICVLELEPEDSGHKLLSALTNNGKLSIVSVISLSRSKLKEIRIAGNALFPVFLSGRIRGSITTISTLKRVLSCITT